MYVSSTWLLKCLQPLRWRMGGDLGPGVLFVQDVIMAGSVEEEDAGVTVFGEDVVIDCPTLASVHVLHQDGDV